MAELPLDQAIPRFKTNEDRIDTFVNGDENATYTTSGGVQVPSVRKVVADFEEQGDGLLAQARAWAEGTLPGGAGTKSSREWAGEAEQARAFAETAAANAQSSALTGATWTALAAITGTVTGQGAEVLDTDTGTHTDPVVGGTVSNAGRYTWSASPAGWKRIGATGLSGKADTSSLSKYVDTGHVGRPDGFTPAASPSVSHMTYTFADAVSVASRIKSITLYVSQVGEFRVGVYTSAGSRVSNTAFTPSATGAQTFTVADFGDISVPAGGYVSLYAPSCFTYYYASADGTGWWQDSGAIPATINVAASKIKTPRIEAQIAFEALSQTVTATSFAAAQSDIATLQSDVSDIQASLANPLLGKKIVAIGDSMVRGHTLTLAQTWLSLIAARNGATAVNYGVNGTYLSNHQYGGTDGAVLRYTAMDSDADFVIVFAGTNDAAALITIGAATSTDTTEFNGALNVLISGLITKYPAKKIMFITPYRRNANYDAYISAIKARCAEHGVPVFDNLTNGGVDWTNAAQISAITLGDTYHLNVSGMQYVSTKYEAMLRSI